MPNKFWEHFFPVEQDFYKMLSNQANATAASVGILEDWLKSGSNQISTDLLRQADEIDAGRMDMEAKLIEAFATPFDRQDIYSLSVEMDKIVEYARSTMEEMIAYGATSDETIINMVQKLHYGTNLLAKATNLLKEDTLEAQKLVDNIREAERNIVKEYRSGMAVLLTAADVRHSIKYREVYQHLKEAGNSLGRATDVFHKIVIRMI
ncbi:hypothetical protein SRRS_32010 [Sporomusa rhizae]|uniref:DUF47 domain-containing protein n=1 Tax=Sporomusa rhizae TaxID=357999 RepID=UPI00352A23FF